MPGAVATRFGERRQPKKRQRNGALRIHPGQLARAHDLVEFIAGHLLAHEAGVRLVVVERVDDVITVTPRVRHIGVALVTGGVGVTREIKPVTAPAFAIAGIVQKLIDQPGVSHRAAVVDEGIRHLRLGRHAKQIKVQPAHQRTSLGQGRRFDTLGFEFGEDKSVDRVADPVRVRHGGRRHRVHRREWPALGQLRFRLFRLAKRGQNEQRKKCDKSPHELVYAGQKIFPQPAECNPLFS